VLGAVPSPVSSLVPTPSVAGHRGASGHRPEHTLDAFALALAMGVDDLELDLVATRDGHLVVRHDTELSRTTDVAARPELAHRRTTRVVDGALLEGWFVDSLTLAELRTVRARERLPRSRPVSAARDGRTGVATLDDVLTLVDDWCASTGQRAGLLLELKHVAHLRAAGLPVDDLVLDALRRHGLDHDRSRVQVMAFEPEPLRRLAGTARVPLLQLVHRPEQVTARALGRVAAYADGIGCAKHLLLGDRGDRVVRDAHRRWLTVHAWTLAAENRFLAPAHRIGSDPDLPGDLAAEARFLLRLGVDGLISDHPDEVVAARDRFVQVVRPTVRQGARRAARLVGPQRSSSVPCGGATQPACREPQRCRLLSVVASSPTAPATTQGIGSSHRTSWLPTRSAWTTAQTATRPRNARLITRCPTWTGCRPDGAGECSDMGSSSFTGAPRSVRRRAWRRGG